jgi:S1-C subfamily serine protease
MARANEKKAAEPAKKRASPVRRAKPAAPAAVPAGDLTGLVADLRQACQDLERARTDAADGWARARTEAAALTEQLRAARDEARALTRDLAAARGARPEPQPPPAPAEAPVGGRNRLGVTVAPGLVVAEVRPDGPAAAAGLTAGDVIEGVNGTAVHTGKDLRDLVHGVEMGSEATFRILRGGSSRDITARHEVPFGGPDEPDDRDWLGLTVEPGAVVAEVLPAGPAAAAGLRTGDVITGVNEDPVAGGVQLREAIGRLLPRAEARLRLTRRGRTEEVTLRLDDPA